MEKRNEDLIKDIHRVELDLLCKFVDVCNKLNLRYSLSSGSLLGAVRHKGFIPWDDDIDVAMPREDYDIFIKEANNILPEGYFLQHYTTEKNTANVFAKLRNSNTTWIVPGEEKSNMNLGIAMDIWPVERVDSLKEHKKIHRKTKIFSALRGAYNLKVKGPSFLKLCVKTLLFPLSRMIGRYRLNVWEDKFNNRSKTGEYTYADQLKRKKLIPYSIFENYKDIEFEGMMFKSIENTHDYLVSLYGDKYMELPPEDKRVTHIAKIVDCENSYAKYIKTRKKK